MYFHVYTIISNTFLYFVFVCVCFWITIFCKCIVFPKRPLCILSKEIGKRILYPFPSGLLDCSIYTLRSEYRRYTFVPIFDQHRVYKFTEIIPGYCNCSHECGDTRPAYIRAPTYTHRKIFTPSVAHANGNPNIQDPTEVNSQVEIIGFYTTDSSKGRRNESESDRYCGKRSQSVTDRDLRNR